MTGRIFFLLVLLISPLCPTSNAQERLRLATTTSTDNSGLLEVLLPPFEKRWGIRVNVIAVGTGKALKLAENGDVDVVLVHNPEAEEEFLRKGFGVNRRIVMYNDFVIVGPPEDPADIRDIEDVREALKRIEARKVLFVSRGDESGTHKKEKSLWREAGIIPQGRWYLEVGQGMGAALQIAEEKRAYCLSDRGTYFAYKDKINLEILFQGDPRLYNPYSIIAVNPARYPRVNYLCAMALIGWVTSREGQRIIAEYKKGGELLFHPLAVQDKR